MNSAKRITIIISLLMVVLILIYALTDQIAPSSARGIVSAHVVQIAPRVSGEVTEVQVSDDAVVQAGAPLFSLDKRRFELAVEQARANLDSTLQSIDASGASLVAAQASVTQARVALDNIRTEADRSQRLEERGLISKSQGDAAQAKVDDAEARLTSAEANLQSARIELGSQGKDNPMIVSATVQLEQAQYDLNSTTIKAPHMGVVTNLTLSSGQYISAGNPALTFIDAEAAWITADFRENQLRNIDPGDPVSVLFDALPGTIFQAKVQSIAWGINPGRNTQGGLVVNQPANRWFEPAREIPVRIELDGGMDAWPHSVRVGGKVHVVVYAGGTSNPISWLVSAVQHVRAWTSYLY